MKEGNNWQEKENRETRKKGEKMWMGGKRC